MGIIRTLTWPLSELVPKPVVRVTLPDGQMKDVSIKKYNRDIRRNTVKPPRSMLGSVPFAESELAKLFTKVKSYVQI